MADLARRLNCYRAAFGAAGLWCAWAVVRIMFRWSDSHDHATPVSVVAIGVSLSSIVALVVGGVRTGEWLWRQHHP